LNFANIGLSLANAAGDSRTTFVKGNNGGWKYEVRNKKQEPGHFLTS
jgi:hypothetical protein